MLHRVRLVVREAVLVALFLSMTAILASWVAIAGRIRRDAPQIERIIQFWAHRFLQLGPVAWTVEGRERIDTTRQYVFVANHLSNFDIPLLLRAIPVPIRFLAKKELFRIPIFGPAMRSAGIVEIDRQGARTAHDAINRAVAEVERRGYSLIIFPEGTRSRTGELQRFKKGAFRMAVDAGLPVVPVVIRGTREVMPPGSKIIHPGRATVTILDPIETRELRIPEDVGTLMERVREEIAAVYEEPD